MNKKNKIKINKCIQPLAYKAKHKITVFCSECKLNLASLYSCALTTVKHVVQLDASFAAVCGV